MAAISVGFMTRLGAVVSVSLPDQPAGEASVAASPPVPPAAGGAEKKSVAADTAPVVADAAASKASAAQLALQTALIYFLTTQSLQ